MLEKDIMGKQNEQNLWRIYVKLKEKFGNESDRDLVNECREKGCVCIGWGDAMHKYLENHDYTNLDIGELEKAMHEAYEGAEDEWCKSSAKHLYEFCTEIKKGDKIIMRGQAGTEDYNFAYVGQVVSDYYFRKTAETGDYWNFFNVACEETPINIIKNMEYGKGTLRCFIFCVGKTLKNLNSRADEVRELIKNMPREG